MNNWMNHPDIKNMDPIKLELFRRAAQQTQGKSGRDLAPILLALITSAQKQGIYFSSSETELILSILKEGKSKEEQNQIDNTIRLVTSMMSKKR